MPRTLLLLALLGLLIPASAQAVVGGERIRRSAAPWFAEVGICGGTLIASDRVATAAHCVDPIDFGDFERISVGGEVRRGVRVALPASWRKQRAGFAADDVAIVQLDRPVTGTRPVPIVAGLPPKLQILGMGQTKVTGPTGRTPLRRATLKRVRDGDCARRWKRSRSESRGRFRGVSEVCAIDANGRAPLDSVCQGDSGGPLIAGTLERPRLVGIISWTGERCGADRLPTVAAEAAHYRAFLLAPEPAWAPVPDGPTRVVRDGATLTCELPSWTVAPERVDVRWERRTRGKTRYELTTVGRGATYTPGAEDRGLLLSCEALGANAGGRTLTPTGPESSIRG